MAKTPCLPEGWDQIAGMAGVLCSACHWHAQLTAAQVLEYLISEARETGDAIAQGAPWRVLGEVGDVWWCLALLTVCLEREFGLPQADALQAAASKAQRRNPHVFGEEAADVTRWEAIKQRERIEEVSGRRGLIAAVSGRKVTPHDAGHLRALSTRQGWRVVELEEDDHRLWAILWTPGSVAPVAASAAIRNTLGSEWRVEWARQHYLI